MNRLVKISKKLESKLHRISQLLIIIFLLSFFLSSALNFSIIYAKEEEPNVESTSAILIDASTGDILYEKNKDTKLYPASITKLMTALLAIENLDKKDSMIFSKNAVFSIEIGSSHIGIREDEILTIDQALHGLLLMSANEVANGLAEEVSGSIKNFAKDMNNRAIELGAKNTHFVNPHGLHDENHYTTAYDMALIAKELLNKEYFLEIMNSITYQIPPTNKVSEIRYLAQQHKMMNESRYPNYFRGDVIGGKTGYTDQAGHTLVTMAKQGNQTLIAVVLKSEKSAMYADTNTLLDYGFEHFKTITFSNKDFSDTITITEDNEKIGEATIQLASPIALTVEEEIKKESIQLKAEYNSIQKNAKIGDIIGKITLSMDNILLAESDATIKTISVQETSNSLPSSHKKITGKVVYIIIAIVVLLSITFYYQIIVNRNNYSRYRRRSYKR